MAWGPGNGFWFMVERLSQPVASPSCAGRPRALPWNGREDWIVGEERSEIDAVCCGRRRNRKEEPKIDGWPEKEGRERASRLGADWEARLYRRDVRSSLHERWETPFFFAQPDGAKPGRSLG